MLNDFYAETKLERHIRCGVEYSTRQHKATGYRSLPQLILGEFHAVELSVVGAIEKYVVDAAHAQEQGYQGEGSDAVLGEEPLGADEAASKTQQDDERAERGGPPADKQRRLVMSKLAEAGWF